MRHHFLCLAAATALVAPAALPAQAPSAAIKAAVAAPTRSPANLARDRYRHPAQTLAFFGVKPTDTIVEFSPAGGWYTEILGPLVNGKGRYIALVGSAKGADSATKMLTAKRAAVGPAATVATMDAAAGTSTVPANSADVVLTFRNIHNLTMGGGANAAGAFKAWFAMLKPGGTLGIVEHRLPAARPATDEKTSGYLKRTTVVALAQAAGFRLAGESEVNANPKDKADYPKGVWTLPPNYAEGDTDRAKYAAIAESDRMTLKFVKPRR
ncbi:class I SAM-dependent methyltransferase [Sphingomonas prati]|uniref:Putative methyltransferase n=1 Tax=Sphingomonas prati TaxID=1843237 RepID=A0A7W9BV35_9SPHN|nr:methyltransferase domain-containing protein [Sphingomonas prati]MBB5730650.1 putative methyltransferase [Sphingomonas prati]GGE96282.1 methyltransferase [Sphingomonas prati]